MSSYKGRLLEVNLTTGAVSHSTVEEERLRRFIGGSGLAARLYGQFLRVYSPPPYRAWFCRCSSYVVAKACDPSPLA